MCLRDSAFIEQLLAISFENLTVTLVSRYLPCWPRGAILASSYPSVSRTPVS